MRLKTLTGVVCLAACAYAQGNGAGNGNGNTEGAGANGKVIHETRDNAKAAGAAATNMSISYHGGPVMQGTTNVYYIWYGEWTGDTATTILTDFAQQIGGSPYFNINTTYTNVSNSVTYAGYKEDHYSQTAGQKSTTSLSDTQIKNIVALTFSAPNAWTPDPNGVYFVLTSPDVRKSGFCTSYCGWHTHATINGVDVKYSFIGNPATQCPSSCSEQTSSSPNGNVGADAMASIIAHELEEAVTDPDLNAWYDKRGAENADKCAWTFGTTSTASNGSLYNMTLTGGRQYLIQRNWVNAGGGYCAMSYTAPVK